MTRHDRSGHRLIEISTGYGTIRCEIFCGSAPVTSLYFLRAVDEGVFGNSSVFRIVDDQWETSGGPQSLQLIQFGHDERDEAIPSIIEHEGTKRSGLRHLKGSLSMARYSPGAVYHSAFICLAASPSLDEGGCRHPDGRGFAVFGAVVGGWEVVEAIFAAREGNEYLAAPIPISQIARRTAPE
jgi:peptidyl-prolyl cis-trans isomerase A (cyclophilin A)